MKRLAQSLGLLLALAAVARAQSFGSSTLPPGSVVDDGSVRVAPLPGTPEATAAGPLAMASLAGTVLPGDFLLLSAQSNRFGPFPYRQDALIGSDRFPYVLQVDSDRDLRLTDPRKHATLGPFRYETGTTIAFEQATLSVLRLPSQVVIVVSPHGRQPRLPTLAMAPLTPATVRALARLRASLATIYNRLSGEVATRGMEGVPLVRDAYGFTYDNTIKASVRDRENARRRAETASGLVLERFQRDGMPFAAACAGGLTYEFASLPPGKYVFCALWRLQERDAMTVAPATIEVWWTTFQIGAQEKMVYALTAENACGWSGIFQFPRFE